MATSTRKRVAHRKSRRGCQNCKNRHVKCDEQGPPCANCIARDCESTCVIPPNVALRKSSTPPELSLAPALPRQNDLVPEKSYMLDLELLHQWTSHTYSTMVCVPADVHYLQVELPRGGLQHPYILKGILCCAALQKSLTAGDVRSTNYYLRIAIHYYDQASSTYQNILSEIPEEDSHYQYMFTMLQGILGSATVKFQASLPSFDVLEFITNFFKIFFSASAIVANHWHSLIVSPMGPSLASTAKIVETAPGTALIDDSFAVSLNHVEAVIDYSFATSYQDSDAELSHRSYRLALSALRLCSTEYVIRNINHVWPAFVFASGREYCLAVAQKDPVALFILLHWAVLVNLLEKNLWWASSLGRPIIIEICRVLEEQQSRISEMPEWVEGLQHCKAEVLDQENISFDSERETMLRRLSQPVDRAPNTYLTKAFWWTG